MKFKTLAGSAVALMLGAVGVSYASPQTSNYYPPERIHCKLNDANSVSCAPFNRQYLTEDVTNADLQRGKEETFHFVSAVAYFSINSDEATVFYTYNNCHQRMVKLKTVNTSIRPDLKNGTWKKLQEDLYICDAGYMNCPITNLPQFS